MVRELTAKMLKLYSGGEFVKESPITAAKLLTPDTVKCPKVSVYLKNLMEMKGKPVLELSDSKCLCDLAFMPELEVQS